MRFLHTEGSTGWGGQEMRILYESLALRSKGHEIIFVVQKRGALADRARNYGFAVYEASFEKKAYPLTLLKLIHLIKLHHIDLIITHSSSDAWIGGIAARCSGKKVIRMRHLSTHIKGGLNSRLLYNYLADFIVTTSSAILPMIKQQARIEDRRITCVPTGVDPKKMEYAEEEVKRFRDNLGLKKGDLLVGSVCFVRSWKGIGDFLQAAHLLKDDTHIRFIVVGGGYLDSYQKMAKDLGLDKTVIFTGHLENPLIATAALDVFVLLSTAHEGISQASLQAAYLSKPLITTPIGGLPEVCLDEVTGFIVPPHNPQEVVNKILLLQDPNLRASMGKAAKELACEQFLFDKTVEDMEKIYASVVER